MRENQKMHWIAEYKNGEIIHETKKEFQEIERNRLKTFSLNGLDTEIKHFVNTGQVKINGNNLLLAIDGNILGRTNDIINFKEGMSIAKHGNYVMGFFTGWKEEIENFKGIQILFWVDFKDQALKLLIKATPEKKSYDFNIIKNGMVNSINLEFKDLGIRQNFVLKLSK